MSDNIKNQFNQSTLINPVFHHYGERKIPQPLTRTPFRPEGFLGRDTELKNIHDRLFSAGGNLLLLVNGEGGIGKTTLASEYYHRFQDKYTHYGWVLSEKSIANALLQLAEPLDLKFEDRMTTHERALLILHTLAGLQRPCLLVIDNANERSDLDQYYQALRRCANFHLLLTSRIPDYEQAERYRIEGLPADKALELFKRHYPKLQEEEAPLVLQIRTAVGGNTLVLELLAKNLNKLNRITQHYDLKHLLRDLQTKGVLQLSQSKTISTDYQSKGDTMRHEKPEDIIAAMYDLGDLAPEAVALLSIFAVLPAEIMHFALLESLLPDYTDLEDILIGLIETGWIEQNGHASAYKVSPVVQEITKIKNQEHLREHCKPLLDTLNRLLKREDLHHDDYQQAAIAATYSESMIRAFVTFDRDLDALYDRMGFYYLQVGQLDKALSIYERQNTKITEKLIAAPDDSYWKNGLATTSSWLGLVHMSLGNLDKALGFYEERNKLGKELYVDYPKNVDFKHGLAISYEKLGSTHTSLGNLDKALGFYEEYNRLSKALYADYPNNVDFKNGLAISYNFLANTYVSLGKLQDALSSYEEYFKISKDLYDANLTNVKFKNDLAISYEKLGTTHTSLGNLDKALGFYEERNRLAKELYVDYPNNVEFKNGLAISYSKLGSTHTSLGNLDKALGFYEDDIKLSKELYDDYQNNVSYKNGLAISYQNLGITHTSLGNLGKALAFFEEYNRLAAALYAAYPNNVEFKNVLAVSYEKLGSTHIALGNLDKALGFYEACNRLEAALYAYYPNNVDFKNGLAISYGKLGSTHIALGNLDKALGFYEVYNKLMGELYDSYTNNVEFKNGLATSYLMLGQFFRDKKHDNAQARHHITQGLALYEALVQDFPAFVGFQRNLSWARKALADLDK
jgi:tetratricopeptide (TPR) repeat protein